jgi:hypothetical protein
VPAKPQAVDIRVMSGAGSCQLLTSNVEVSAQRCGAVGWLCCCKWCCKLSAAVPLGYHAAVNAAVLPCCCRCCCTAVPLQALLCCYAAAGTYVLLPADSTTPSTDAALSALVSDALLPPPISPLTCDARLQGPEAGVCTTPLTVTPFLPYTKTQQQSSSNGSSNSSRRAHIALHVDMTPLW